VGNASFPRSLRRIEQEFIAARRQEARVDANQPLIGVALSGGGIRSATFALGLLQALASARLLRSIDYLSTVSGGGYCGAFLGALYCRTPGGAVAVDAVEQSLRDDSSPAVSWLRENGRYLAPGGGGDVLAAVAWTVRNWLAVHITMGAYFLAIFLLLQLSTGWISERLRHGLNLNSQPFDPLWLLPLAVLLLCVAPLAACYWLIADSQGGPHSAAHQRSLWPALLPMYAYLVVLAGCYSLIGRDGLVSWLAALLTLTILLSLVAYIVIAIWTWRQTRGSDGELQSLDRRTMLRNLSTDWLGGWVGVMLGLVCLALVDMCGGWLYSHFKGQHSLATWLTGLSSMTVIPPLAQKLAKMAGGRAKMSELVESHWNLVWAALALVLGFVLLVVWNALAHAIIAWLPDGESWVVWSAVLWLAILIALAGNTLSFINRSSLESFYQARLTRAYLGASNQERRDPANADVSDAIAGDGMTMSQYQPHARGGPLHLINVTINETVDGRSNIEQRDRKGLPLAIGPAGVSAGVRHHALWCRGTLLSIAPRTGFRIFPKRPAKAATTGHGLMAQPVAASPIVPESLDLGNWTAISGAAASTGTGMNTSFGLSLLCGLANVRLGYWWNSGIDPRARDQIGPPGSAGHREPGRSTPALAQRLGEAVYRLLPVYCALLDEWTARFHGPARRYWNLSDGGHFENLGVYELLRRRLPLIIASDAECDPNYQFGDLARLVRKARTDFGAHITILNREELEMLGPEIADLCGELHAIGPQDSPGQPAFSKRVAALARIEYSSEPPAPPGQAATGWLIVIKAAVTGQEPVDVLDYHRQNPGFPQQSTLEQFFDEAQWESYRCLGQFIGQRLTAMLPILLQPASQPAAGS
jgi:hypothetical protein